MALGITMNRTLRRTAIVFVACFALSAPVQAENAPDASSAPAKPMGSMPSWSPLVKRVLPAVVNISAEISPETATTDGERQGEDGVEQGNPADFYDFLRRYFEQRGAPSGTPLSPGVKTTMGGKMISVGSAFVIDPTGYIVTNSHVVARAAKITVIFPDNSQHLATIVGSDPKTDIALLKISVNRNLPFLQWGDSDKVEVGDWVMTVGNPFGLGGTVTAGVVSALGRNLQQGPFDDFLQIDAPINRGSSGGPTFDTNGRVVGINAAIYSPTGGSIGIGFAIPSSIAKVIVQKLRDSGRADHGYLGIGLQSISPEIARTLRIDPERPMGLLVNTVSPDSPAAKAGIQTGDVIKKANGHTVMVPYDISKFVITAKIGDKLLVTLDRDGKTRNLEVIVAQTPTPKQLDTVVGRQNGDPAEGPTVMGIWFADLTADLRRELHLATSVEGVVIGGMDVHSAAAAIGLLPGDVVISIDKQPTAQPAAAMQKLRAATGEGDVLILVNRHGANQFMVLPVQSKDGRD
ncbi:trypsin-like peptidase domain-containing protein [Telmatospirillum siberiense]|uniref:Serine protease n=1 Tax=Telmatospirillum siberiense TaxID=382514 RepID=A0A2N3PQ06_9PROT|nr:trypsin-like peptidase domain-containing protein [Telmatospirillum siberiense]PKU22486.1 serine protease [Telmatospirillum siberiense]